MSDACDPKSGAPRRFTANREVVQKATRTQTRRKQVIVTLANFLEHAILQIPAELLENEALAQSISVLPSNYNFEILKTVWRLQQASARCVALQFPEGLLMYACVISDILTRFASLEHCFILGDVTYGACCVDDFTAMALKCDFLVHYGHSCLVPVDVTQIPCLYIFVTVDVDINQLVQTLEYNLPPESHLAIAGTIQFSPAIHAAKEKLAKVFAEVIVPQSRPLSGGEVLGCTAPRLPDTVDTLVFIADGRFHLEAMMIANPHIPAFRYDPYTSRLVQEFYDHDEMKTQRRKAIEAARRAQRWGVILGSLGRQGNPAIVQKLREILINAGKTVISFVMSEILPTKLAKIKHIDAWVQVGCPRLSIDWGKEFTKPVLTPYEAMVAFEKVGSFWEGDGLYPMDYYAKKSGPWSSSYHKNRRPAMKPVHLTTQSS